MMGELGKFLIVIGIFFVVLGVALMGFSKFSFLGRLPGDIVWRKGNFTFYFPIVTSIILSVLLTFIFWLFTKMK